jgi:hypothetical protein
MIENWKKDNLGSIIIYGCLLNIFNSYWAQCAHVLKINTPVSETQYQLASD